MPIGTREGVLFPRFSRRLGIQAEFLAHMGELFWIGKPPIAHHRAQFGEACLGKEQPRQMLTGIEPHQTSFQKLLSGRRDFGLAGLRATAPSLQHEAFGDRRKGREEHVELATDIVAFAG
jgi:hypothetical protein